MVACDAADRPQTVWTGSVNWTTGSLYAQDSNALLIRDQSVAHNYLERWQRLRADPTLSVQKAANARAASVTLGDGSLARLWSAPVNDAVDLADVRGCLRASRSAILFAIGPRSRRSLVDDILPLAKQLFVAGVARTVDGGKHVTVHRNGEQLITAPDSPPKSATSLLGSVFSPMPPIGTRLIVIDPFDERPVVIGGSHYLSTPASSTNDEDLVIIEGDAELAAQCAVHIQGLIDHYWFRAGARASNKNLPVALRPGDDWQLPFLEGRNARDIQFWIGSSRLRRQSQTVPQHVTDDAAPAPLPRSRGAKPTRKRVKRRKKSATAGPGKSRRSSRRFAMKRTAKRTVRRTKRRKKKA
jgi:hypothetical protein